MSNLIQIKRNHNKHSSPNPILIIPAPDLVKISIDLPENKTACPCNYKIADNTKFIY